MATEEELDEPTMQYAFHSDVMTGLRLGIGAPVFDATRVHFRKQNAENCFNVGGGRSLSHEDGITNKNFSRRYAKKMACPRFRSRPEVLFLLTILGQLYRASATNTSTDVAVASSGVGAMVWNFLFSTIMWGAMFLA